MTHFVSRKKRGSIGDVAGRLLCELDIMKDEEDLTLEEMIQAVAVAMAAMESPHRVLFLQAFESACEDMADGPLKQPQ